MVYGVHFLTYGNKYHVKRHAVYYKSFASKANECWPFSTATPLWHPLVCEHRSIYVRSPNLSSAFRMIKRLLFVWSVTAVVSVFLVFIGCTNMWTSLAVKYILSVYISRFVCLSLTVYLPATVRCLSVYVRTCVCVFIYMRL